jgi:hypothetical protein
MKSNMKTSFDSKQQNKEILFPPYMYVESVLEKKNLQKLIETLDVENKPEKESQIFNRTTREHLMDSEIRSSKKVEYKDKNLFAFVDEHIIPVLNQNELDFNFMLIHDDLQVVKYSKGGHFNKHQDFVNFTSNEFQNYSFVLCVKSCSEGGETILHFDEKPFKFDTGKKLGSLLLFQKDTIHEGCKVVEGEKQVLIGNLICFPKSKKEDCLIVTFTTSPNQFIIPVSKLPKESVYFSFYHFNKTKETQIYHYLEEKVDLKNFMKFYFSIIDVDPMDTEKLDYIGLNLSETIYNLNHFLNFSKENILIVPKNEYYSLIHHETPKTILPFQYVSFVTGDQEFVLWLGVYDNIFLACHIASETTPEEVEQNLQYLIESKKSPGLFHFNEETLIFNMCLEKNEKNENLKLVHKKFNSKKMNEIFEMDAEKSKRKRTKINTFEEENSKDQLSQEVDKFIWFCINSVNDDTEYAIEQKFNKSTEKKNVPEKIFLNSLDKLDVVQICDLIQSTKPLSEVKSTAHSNYSCNETNYISIRVEIKFGFIRMHEK